MSPELFRALLLWLFFEERVIYGVWNFANFNITSSSILISGTIFIGEFLLDLIFKIENFLLKRFVCIYQIWDYFSRISEISLEILPVVFSDDRYTFKFSTIKLIKSIFNNSFQLDKNRVEPSFTVVGMHVSQNTSVRIHDQTKEI